MKKCPEKRPQQMGAKGSRSKYETSVLSTVVQHLQRHGSRMQNMGQLDSSRFSCTFAYMRGARHVQQGHILYGRQQPPKGMS